MVPVLILLGVFGGGGPSEVETPEDRTLVLDQSAGRTVTLDANGIRSLTVDA